MMGKRHPPITGSPDHRITRSFKSKPALVAYVTCGDPNIAATRDIVLAACRGGLFTPTDQVGLCLLLRRHDFIQDVPNVAGKDDVLDCDSTQQVDPAS